MTYFTEIDWTNQPGGHIVRILPDSLASEIDIQAGDQLLGVNGNKVVDIIDVRFYSAEENLELFVRRKDQYFIFEAFREYDQELGLEFQHPTFDVDIRRCNNLCEFCFVLQMAPRFRRTLYIKDDDYRYSFLFGHYVTLTNLDQHDWWKIETMRLSPLFISVHATDLEIRRRFLRNSNAPDIMGQLGRLADAGIEMHTQLVIAPGVNDGQLMEQSIVELASLWPKVRSISVVPVGLTSHHKYQMRTHTKDEAGIVLDQITRLQKEFRHQFKVGFVYPTDEWFLVAGREIPQLNEYDNLMLQENGLGMVRDFLTEWELVKNEISQWIGDRLKAPKKPDSVTFPTIALVTGSLFSAVLKDVAKELSRLIDLDIQVIAAENIRLGKTITVAGLLMAEDVFQQLSVTDLADMIILPRIMFDHPDVISLDDITPQQLADRIGRPIALADQMGDVWDAILNRSSTIYYPSP